MRIGRTAGLSAVAGLLVSAAANAQEAAGAGDLWQALTGGKPTFDIRYRFEAVDQANRSREARASTLRTRFGYGTLPYYGFSGFLEFEHVGAAGPKRYNDTINGRTAYPIVADPEAIEVNQAFVNFAAPQQTNLRFGRQRIMLDNQRFIGNVGFRQNEQTFDAFSVSNKTFKDLELFYSYLWNVNRVFGDRSPVGDWRSDTHLVNAAYATPFGRLTGYGYLLDIENAPAFSSQTYGVRFAGKYEVSTGLAAVYALEYARQADYGNNPADFGLDYYLIEPGIAFRGVTVKVGYEVMDGNGAVAFQTPLATLHAFSGFTDLFLTTPPNGLKNTYVTASYSMPTPLGSLTLSGWYQNFSAERGGAHYGSEWAAEAALQVTKSLALSVKYADYNADSFAVDTRKLWLTANLKY